MRSIQKEKNLLNSLYIYDSKTSANPTNIENENIKYEFTFANRILDNDYLEGSTYYVLEEEYTFDSFIITKDSYLIKIDGVRQKANYATREQPKIKLTDINNVSRTIEYLLNYCKDEREILLAGNKFLKNIKTNYNYVKTCLEEMLLNNLTKEDFELVFKDLKRDVKDVIADRLENVYLKDVNYSDLRWYNRFETITKEEALRLKNDFLSTYEKVVRVNNYDYTREYEAFKMLTNLKYKEEIFTQVLRIDLISNSADSKEQLKEVFKECISVIPSIAGIHVLSNSSICEIIWNDILINTISNIDDEYFKYYLFDFMKSEAYSNIKKHNIKAIMDAIE